MALKQIATSVAVTKDAHIHNGGGALIAEDDVTMKLGKKFKRYRILMELPIPSGIFKLQSCTLKVYFSSVLSTNDSDGFGQKARIYRLRHNNWVEGEVMNRDYATGMSWGALGADDPNVDYFPGDSVAIRMPQNGVTGWASWDIKRLVRAAQADGLSVLSMRINWIDEITIDFLDTVYSRTGTFPPVADFVYLETPGTKNARQQLGLSRTRGGYVDANNAPSLQSAGRSTDDFLTEQVDDPGGSNFDTNLQPR